MSQLNGWAESHKLIWTARAGKGGPKVPSGDH